MALQPLQKTARDSSSGVFLLKCNTNVPRSLCTTHKNTLSGNTIPAGHRIKNRSSLLRGQFSLRKHINEFNKDSFKELTDYKQYCEDNGALFFSFLAAYEERAFYMNHQYLSIYNKWRKD